MADTSRPIHNNPLTDEILVDGIVYRRYIPAAPRSTSTDSWRAPAGTKGVTTDHYMSTLTTCHLPLSPCPAEPKLTGEAALEGNNPHAVLMQHQNLHDLAASTSYTAVRNECCPAKIHTDDGGQCACSERKHSDRNIGGGGYHSSSISYPEDLNQSETIWNAYLYGQSCNVAKAAVWWSLFGTVVTALLSSDAAVGVSRAAFNGALVLVSPLAGAVAERAKIRTSLIVTTASRMSIWSFFIPLAWIVCESYIQNRLITWSTFCILMFLDGVQVAFANVVDIDCGGFETLSIQYDIPINDYTRSTFNSVHQMVFDLSFVLLTPPIAFAILEISHWISRVDLVMILGLNPETVSVLIGVSVSFLVLSTISLWCYTRGLPKDIVQQPHEYSPAEVVIEGDAADSPQQKLTIWQETKSRITDVALGFNVVKKEKSLGWRLLFLAFETALEDSMVSVVIPYIAAHSPKIFAAEGRVASAAVWAVSIIAVGKIGGLLCGLYMGSRWNPPLTFDRAGSYRTLFWCVLCSSLSLFLFPLAAHLVEQGNTSPTFCGCLIFLGSFLFFVFSTAPKIGFASLLQNLVAGRQTAGVVFSFVGTFVTTVDGVVILLICVIFVFLGPVSHSFALVAVSSVYLVHGLLEAFAGPLLVLELYPTSGVHVYEPYEPFPVASQCEDMEG